MKSQFNLLKFFVGLLFCFLFFSKINSQDIDIEKIREKCKGIPYEDRVTMTVARFSVSTPSAYGEFGGELATMLTNALQQINCFRILESMKNLSDMTDEIGLGQSGLTNGNTSPKSGQMIGAQAVLTGEITEFYEGAGKVGAFGISVTNNKARIGFIIKVINPGTRDVIFSRSVEAEGKKPGAFSGVKLFGVELAGSSKSNTAIGDAVERGIIKAVQILADEKDNIPFPKPYNGTGAVKNWNSSNCPLISSGKAPSVMVLIPEKHVNYWLPKPNGEIEFIKKFTNAGFTVIDPAMYATIRKEARFEAALSNPTAAAALGNEFGADVIIIGEGISQTVGNQNNMISCRASVSAKVVSVRNAQVLMAESTEAGGADIAETAASNISLKKAGGDIADLFLEKFCTQELGITNEGSKTNTSVCTIKISGTDFAKLKKMSESLKSNSKIKEVKQVTFSGSNAVLEIKHEVSADDILGFISEKCTSICEITGFNASEITVKMK